MAKPVDILKGLTPEQRVAVLHLAGPAMVMSCAGSGKTSTITKRIAYLIKHGVSPTNIVGVTFTNKAAGEMKERVQRLVGGAGRHVWLSTFHSFCVTLLRANYKQYGVPRNFTIADEGDANGLAKIAIATVSAQMHRSPEEDDENVRYVRSWISGHKDYLRTPDDVAASNTRFPEYIPFYREYQRRLVHDGMLDFDDLIMKTVLGLQRNEGLQKFYNDNIHHLLVDEWQDTNFSQFELVRLLTQRRGNVFIVGDTDQCLPADTLVATPTGEIYIDKIRERDEVWAGCGQRCVQASKVKSVKARMYSGPMVHVTLQDGGVLRATPEHCVFGLGKNAKRDGKDLVILGGPDGGHVIKDPQGNVLATFTQYDDAHRQAAAAVDGPCGLAIQLDPDVAPYRFMPIGQLAVGDAVPRLRDGKVVQTTVQSVATNHYGGWVFDLDVPGLRNYCADGTFVHNSIYGWRGADIHNTERFYKAFPETKTYVLQTNFRSVPGIAAVANALIMHNTKRPDKTIVTHKRTGEIPKSYELRTTDDEARFVINTIRDMVKRGKDDWRDFAVIYRIRSLSRAVEDVAVGRNVPYRVIGSLSFYNRAAIKDILAYARLLVNPREDSSFARIINKPTRGIGTASFAAFNRAAEAEDMRLFVALGKRLYTKCGILASAVDGFRRLRDVFAMWRRMDQRKAGPIIESILHNSGYLGYAENIKDEKYRDRVIEDIYELVDAAKHFDEAKSKKRRKGLRGFLEHTQLMQQEDKDEDPNSITLLTAHAAKGLEFKNVFVIGCVDGVTPLHPREEPGRTLTPGDTQQHYEEERRVFFVAVTRAEERLWLTWPRARRSYGGGMTMSEPSQFLEEGMVVDAYAEKEEKKDHYNDANEIDAGGGIRIYGITRQPKTEIKRKDGGANAIIRNRTQNLSEGQSEEDLRDARREHLRRLATRGIAAIRPTKSNH